MAEKQIAGIVGFYKTPHQLIEATKKIRDARFYSFDTFSPFPIHGIDEAQGLKRSKLPYITLVFGIMGCVFGFGLQYWTSVIDWPINVGGKPFNSWPAFVPVMFELTILFAGISTVVGMILINRLPNIKKKAFDPAVTRDRFAIMIDAMNPPMNDEGKPKVAGYKTFTENEAEALLKSAGATEVRKVYAEGWF